MASQSPFAASIILRWLFVLGVIAIPFDAVAGLSAFGELANELSFPFFALAILAGIVCSLRAGSNRISSSLALKIGAGIVAVVFLSWALNAFAIASATVRDRSGSDKFLTSLLVIIYGIGLAWIAEQLDETDVRRLLTRAIVWSAVIVTIYGLFELVGRQGPLTTVFNAVDHAVHTRQNDIINAWNGSINFKVLYNWDLRLRSVSFEPPAFGNFCGLAWPWVWFSTVAAPPARKVRAWAILIAFTAIIIIGQSRTGELMLAVDIGVIAALRWLYAPPRPTGEAAAMLRLAIPLAAGLILVLGGAFVASNSQILVNHIVAGDSVSDLSRLGFQIAAFRMFLANPLLGVGLGQFAFHVAQYLPDWAFRSPEVAPMLYYPTGPWPAVYSLYGRLAAELGIVGVLGWVALWLTLAWRLTGIARARAFQGETCGIEYPLIANAFGVLTSSIASDTFRTPMFWIALGCSCALVKAARASRAATPILRRVPSEEPALHRSR